MEKTTPPVATPVVKPPKDEKNGVTRPKVGTTCGTVWAICDKLSEEAKAPAERAKVIAAATAQGINAATVATQHGKWRKYYGLVTVTQTAEQKAAAKADADKVKADAKAAKDAEKAAKVQAKAAAKAIKDAEKAAKAVAAAVPPVTPAAVPDVVVQ